MDFNTIMKVEPLEEASDGTCALCGAAASDLFTLDEHDVTRPGSVPLRAQLLALTNNKALPAGRVCGDCANRTAEAYAFQKLVASRSTGAPDSLSEKIRSLRRRLHQLTQQVDVFIVVGDGGGGTKPTYSERDIIMVDRDALAAAAAYDDGSALGVDADARGDTVYQCSVCPQSFRKAAEYAAHAATHPNESVHSCWTCGAQFPSRAALAAHRPLHETTLAATPAPCHLCGAMFASVAELRRHEAACEPRCPVCGELFSSRATLGRHATESHGRSAPPPHLCPVCFESFERGEQLTAHALHHRQARQFVCGYDGCILRFAARENLLSHIRKCHSGTADDEGEPAETEDATPALVPTCRDCGRTFGSTAALKRHSRVHSRVYGRGGAGRGRGRGRPRRVELDSSADEDVSAAAAALINEENMQDDTDDMGLFNAEYLEELEEPEDMTDTKPNLDTLNF